MSLRHGLVLVCLGLTAITGCSALSLNNSSNTSRANPGSLRPSMTVSEIIDKNNRNAQGVTSLEANPTIAVRGGGRIFAAGGRMALERPHNFRLKLKAGMSDADIGSNDDVFWVSMPDRRERKIYAGHYDATGSASGALTFQPDWVIESLGLREIGSEEEAEITTQKGKDASTLTLVHKRYNSKGVASRKVTIVDSETGQVREHLFYGGDDPKSLLARAIVGDYRKVAVASEDGESSVELPRKIKIQWWFKPGQEPLLLDVTMGEPKVITYSEEERLTYFEMPRKSGYEVVWLNEAEGKGVSERSKATTSRSSVRLGEPVKLEADDASRTATDPIPLGASVSANSPPTDAGLLPASADQPPALPRDLPAGPGSTAKTRSSWFRHGN